MYIFAFAHTYKDINYAASSGELTPQEIRVVETNALYGICIDPIVRQILKTNEVEFPMYLRGNPPVGTCTICVGKKEIGAKNHFGVLRTMEKELFYVGE